MVKSMALGANQTKPALALSVIEWLCAFGRVTNFLGSSVSLSMK